MISIARSAALAFGTILAIAASTGQAGEFSVQLRAASDDTMMGLPSCRIEYTASNGMDAAVRRASFRVLPLAVEGSTTASASAASGESLANIGPVASGESTENSFKVRGAPCKNLNGLKLVAFYCVREPDKANCSAQMSVTGTIPALPLIMP
jgi:hypothetical protein